MTDRRETMHRPRCADRHRTSPTDYAGALGRNLRSARENHGLSLRSVESASHGRLKAVTVSAYERGERAVTVDKLAELAMFYDVTVRSLLPSDGDGAPDGAVAG